MRLPCEKCGELHIDEGEFATKPHHTHSCQHCGLTWRPAVVHTVGVRFLPGFKNEPAPTWTDDELAANALAAAREAIPKVAEPAHHVDVVMTMNAADRSSSESFVIAGARCVCGWHCAVTSDDEFVHAAAAHLAGNPSSSFPSDDDRDTTRAP